MAQVIAAIDVSLAGGVTTTDTGQQSVEIGLVSSQDHHPGPSDGTSFSRQEVGSTLWRTFFPLIAQPCITYLIAQQDLYSKELLLSAAISCTLRPSASFSFSHLSLIYSQQSSALSSA